MSPLMRICSMSVDDSYVVADVAAGVLPTPEGRPVQAMGETDYFHIQPMRGSAIKPRTGVCYVLLASTTSASRRETLGGVQQGALRQQSLSWRPGRRRPLRSRRLYRH